MDGPVAPTVPSRAQVTTRRAQAADVAAIARLYAIAFPIPRPLFRVLERWLRERHLKRLVEGGHGVYVLALGARVLGSVWICARRDGIVEANNLCLDPEATRLIGSHAWSRFFCEALAQHCPRYPLQLSWESERPEFVATITRAFRRRALRLELLGTYPAAPVRYELRLSPMPRDDGRALA